MGFEFDPGGGGGSGNVIASGTRDSVPDVSLQPGMAYSLLINLPFAAPGWIAGAISTALQGIGLRVYQVTITGGTIQVDFGT